jgi:hypothetical protein
VGGGGRDAHRKTAHGASDEFCGASEGAGIIILLPGRIFGGDDPKREVMEAWSKACVVRFVFQREAELCFPGAPPALLCAVAFLLLDYSLHNREKQEKTGEQA